jgi:hypothetical protein
MGRAKSQTAPLPRAHQKIQIIGLTSSLRIRF